MYGTHSHVLVLVYCTVRRPIDSACLCFVPRSIRRLRRRPGALLMMLLLQLALLLPLSAHAVVWEDKCGGDWLQCRANTIKSIFNSTSTPARDPDFTIPYSDYRMKGLPGPGNGTGVGNVEWENNLTALVWTMTGPFLTLNTTVFWSLNTSGRAAANYNPPPYSGTSGPGIPPAGTTFDTSFAPQVVPHEISDTPEKVHGRNLESGGHRRGWRAGWPHAGAPL